MTAGAADDERYAEFEPPVTLRPFVRKIWTYAAPRPSGAIQRIAPDGCPELILNVGRPYEEAGDDGLFRPQPSAIFAGQMSRPMSIRPAGPVELVAVRFEPDGARDWLGYALAETTDRRVDVVDRLAELRPRASDLLAQVEMMTRWLETHRQRSGWTLDPLARSEVEAASREQAPLTRGASEQRALQRRFTDRVGVSPRMLRSIFRFRRIFDYATEGDPAAAGWLEAGLRAGYFDQPQMARDFRRFLGCTATEWARDQAELARRIASQSYKPGVQHLA